ncbi:MAG: DNA polymerase III subunit chi, partial [Chitinophagaceae bacterium]
FIAHQIIGGGEEAKVEITFTTEAGNHHDVLINLSRHIPDYFSRFDRLSEVVIQESAILENTREHYRFYKQRGYPITQHNR